MSVINRKKQTLPQRLTLSAAISAALLVGYGGRNAYAGTCTGATGTYTCSGAANNATDSTQSLNAGANPLSITTIADFGIDTRSTGGRALTLSTGGSSLSFTDNNMSNISGEYDAIHAINNGSGATSITTTGSVISTEYYGIYVRNGNSSTGLTINAAAVAARYNAIDIRNNGAGATNITCTGMVTGTSDRGIFALNASTASDLTINTAAVTGVGQGIYAQNNGEGAISITSSDLVRSLFNTGIHASNTSNGTDITLNTVSVSGRDSHGIGVSNNGTGATLIISSVSVGVAGGDGGGHGVNAFNAGTATDLTINTASVKGWINGINASNNSTTGMTSITVSGNVNASSVPATGAGINNSTDGNGSISLITLNSGAAVSATSGIAISDNDGDTTVTINTGASVTGSINLGAGTDQVILDGGTLNVHTGKTLSVTGDVINSTGVINLQNSTIDATATINGNFTGGGTLNIDTVLGDETSASDVLIITGDTSDGSSGATSVNINNLGGLGATPANDGILVVQVNGTSNGIFTLANPINVNGFEYTLVKVNTNWYLQSAAVDVSMSKTLLSTGQFNAGDVVTYELIISNAGPADATNVVIADTFSNLSLQSITGGSCAPASFPCTIASLANGTNETLTVTASIISAGVFDNSATATPAELDLNPANNTDNTDNGGATANVDVSIVKNLISTGPFNVGDTVTYEIIIANAGPDTANGIVLTDSMTHLSLVSVTGGTCTPATFPCSIATLANGDSETLTVQTTIDAVGAFDNSATITVIENDTNLTNNTDNTGNGGTTVINNISPDFKVMCDLDLTGIVDTTITIPYFINFINSGEIDQTTTLSHNIVSDSSSLLTNVAISQDGELTLTGINTSLDGVFAEVEFIAQDNSDDANTDTFTQSVMIYHSIDMTAFPPVIDLSRTAFTLFNNSFEVSICFQAP